MTRDPRLPPVPFSFWQRAGYNLFQILDHFISRPVTVKLFGKLRYRLFLKTVERLKAKGEGKLIPVERREDLSLKEFKEYYVKRRIPVILSGAAKEWGCAKSWSPEYFKEKHGDDEVPIFDGVDIEGGIEYITLSELIDKIEEGNNKAYFRFYNLLTRHPEHHADFDLDWLKEHSHKGKYFEAYQAFIGGAGSVTEIHHAHISNLFVQAYGVKEWVLYPNYNIPFIDPPSTMNGIFRNVPIRAGNKPFSPFTPDYEGYPYFKYLDGYTAKLEPGDVLYNPPFVWHTVRNETKSIGVGYRWINAWHSFRSSPVYYLLDVMAYRPSYFKSLAMVRKNANKQFEHRIKMMKRYAAKQGKPAAISK